MSAPTYLTEACRSCGTQVIWAVTATGKDMPVDVEPTTDGNVALARDTAGALRARVVPPHLAFGRRDLRLSHFVRCPQASRWRRR